MITEIVSNISPMSASSLNELVDLAQDEHHKKGVTFISKGSRNGKEYFVLAGICRSYLISPEGEQITISFFTSGTVLSPFVTRSVNGFSNLNFEAVTKLKVGSMDAKKFENLMVNNLEIREFGNAVLRNELQQKVNKEIGMASLTAKERLIEFRKQFQTLENFVPHTMIATYLGITNISLSRLRRDLMN